MKLRKNVFSVFHGGGHLMRNEEPDEGAVEPLPPAAEIFEREYIESDGDPPTTIEDKFDEAGVLMPMSIREQIRKEEG